MPSLGRTHDRSGWGGTIRGLELALEQVLAVDVIQIHN
jgi:hypothetical protein